MASARSTKGAPTRRRANARAFEGRDAAPPKRHRRDDEESLDDDDDDDDVDDADDRDDGTDASLAIVAGTRETRVGDGDEEAGGRGRAADERRRAPISVKAPPLLKEQISRLSEAEQRKVLGRWNARLRGLKRRVEDMSHQFPTSSLVLVFTKPFRSKDRRGKWCVVRDDDARFVARATRCHATED